MKKPFLMAELVALALGLALAGGYPAAAQAAELVIGTSSVPWQQVSEALIFTVFPEREEYSTLDRVGRVVFVVEAGSRPRSWKHGQGTAGRDAGPDDA